MYIYWWHHHRHRHPMGMKDIQWISMLPQLYHLLSCVKKNISVRTCTYIGDTTIDIDIQWVWRISNGYRCYHSYTISSHVWRKTSQYVHVHILVTPPSTSTSIGQVGYPMDIDVTTVIPSLMCEEKHLSTYMHIYGWHHHRHRHPMSMKDIQWISMLPQLYHLLSCVKKNISVRTCTYIGDTTIDIDIQWVCRISNGYRCYHSYTISSHVWRKTSQYVHVHIWVTPPSTSTSIGQVGYPMDIDVTTVIPSPLMCEEKHLSTYMYIYWWHHHRHRHPMGMKDIQWISMLPQLYHLLSCVKKNISVRTCTYIGDTTIDIDIQWVWRISNGYRCYHSYTISSHVWRKTSQYVHVHILVTPPSTSTSIGQVGYPMDIDVTTVIPSLMCEEKHLSTYMHIYGWHHHRHRHPMSMKDIQWISMLPQLYHLLSCVKKNISVRTCTYIGDTTIDIDIQWVWRISNGYRCYHSYTISSHV